MTHTRNGASVLLCCRFINMGGWDTLHGWLQEMRDEENSPLLMELLKVYQKLPVTIDLLKQNNAPKTIKQLSKTEDASK